MKVAIIEDDPEVIEAVSLCLDLRWPEIEVVTAQSGIGGVDLVASESPDIVVLDIALPDIDGFEICRRIRCTSDVPIVMLTACDRDVDKIRGLALGADDYITKPSSHTELLARIKAVLRRCTTADLQDEEGTFTMGKVWIDFAGREVRVDNQELRLTPTEYNLLHLLAKNAGRVIPHQVLLEKVWGGEYEPDAAKYVKVYIQRLREKLGDDASTPKLILSERGIGYKITEPLQEVQRSEAFNKVGKLTLGDHVSYLFDSDEEQQFVLTALMTQGLKLGQKVIYIVDARSPETIFRWMWSGGLKIDSYVASGQFKILLSDGVYLPEGTFDPDDMIARLHRETVNALGEGYSGLRLTGEMTWAQRGSPGSDRLLEYESRLTPVFADIECLAMCQYDKRQFDSEFLKSVVRYHTVGIGSAA